MTLRFKRLLRACAFGLALTAPALSQAAWPEKPITLIVPWAAGGSTDILARVLSEGLTQSLGQSVIVENRSGASGNIGTTFVARAKPDGYTLLVGSMSTHTMNQALYSNMPFDGVKDFTPIAELALVTNTMVVHPSVPAANLKEFIAYVKERPDTVAYASAGQGSTNHLSAALFEKAAGVKMMHIPYRGGAPAVLDTVAGRTQVLFSAGTQTLPHVQTGKLKLLAVTEEKRSPLLPEVPTVAETLPGYELSVWYGAFGPAGMPPELTARLNREINLILKRPDVIKKMGDMGVLLTETTPEQFGQILVRDADKYGKLIKELGITAE
ncbi:tripartite tricarboxylate transporter substrate binding protein [Achromobacter sp. UMC46]|uniref:Bug family tripartite tricarboxylate transporter substrate binding protein n=1 Tax=Achromobacter sp. UMC46 TaxID=1862319 RepID=UPI00160390BE|nr:tripartite tricarboxylate transporter substrate binding protein [Achromobacter sp. UMC46]MBB1596759.1 ABC transporter substrate-binding protein [Achromobacter sp. UMC46]